MEYVELNWEETLEVVLGDAMLLSVDMKRNGGFTRKDSFEAAENYRETLPEEKGWIINYEAAVEAFEVARETRDLIDRMVKLARSE